MIFEIPTSTAPRFSQRTTLEGVDYLLVLDWNARGGHWTLSLYTTDETPILVGAKLVNSWPLLRGATASDRPPGQIMVIDTSGGGADPGLDDLGSKCRLYYFDSSEVKPRA